MTATPVTTPGAPQRLRSEPGDAQVTLRWDAPTSDGGVPQARAAVQRGKVATILESLRRQDGERFTLPDRLQWAIDDRDRPPGVPHPRIGTTTLAMLLRCGPSGW